MKRKRIKHSLLPLNSVAPNGLTIRENVVAQINNLPFWAAGRQLLAKSSGLRTYPDYCDAHGATDFGALSGRCVHCPPPEDAREDRVTAKMYGLTDYDDDCPLHGRVAHAVRNGVCLSCRTVDGHVRVTSVGRPLTGGARAVARREGRTTYPATCETHGETEHSVLRGKCLTCFNALGARRPGQ